MCDSFFSHWTGEGKRKVRPVPVCFFLCCWATHPYPRRPHHLLHIIDDRGPISPRILSAPCPAEQKRRRRFSFLLTYFLFFAGRESKRNIVSKEQFLIGLKWWKRKEREYRERKRKEEWELREREEEYGGENSLLPQCLIAALPRETEIRLVSVVFPLFCFEVFPYQFSVWAVCPSRATSWARRQVSSSRRSVFFPPLSRVPYSLEAVLGNHLVFLI